MKAIRVKQFGPPEVLGLASIPSPIAAADQVVVRLEASGVNPVDTYIRAGEYARLPELPYTPGSDGAGTILSLGTAVAGLQIGQRVYLSGSITGTYAEEALCHQEQVHPLPERLSFLQGAALGVPYVTAHFALFSRGLARSGETVLIHGATGGVGIAAIQFARAAGLRVLATGGTENGRRLVAEQGAEAVFDHTEPNYLARIQQAAGSGGVNLVVEMLANVNLGKDLSLLAPGGRVVVVGSRGPVEINPRELMARNADVRGVMVAGAPPEDLARAHAALRSGLESGSLNPVVGRTFPLEKADQAHALVRSPGALGKIVLVR